MMNFPALEMKERSHVSKFGPIFPFSNFGPLSSAEWVIGPLAPKFYSLIQNNNGPQECIPVGCVLSAGKGEGSAQFSWMQTFPLDADPPGGRVPLTHKADPLEADPPGHVT